MAPFILRLNAYLRDRRQRGFDPVNLLSPPRPGPHQGVPLGGIGGGSIGRGWRGGFRRWQLRLGMVHHAVVFADQFAVCALRDGEPPAAQVLCPEGPPPGALSAWRWDLPPAGAEYHALYPRAWTTYAEPLPGIRLACRQLSPVIPHNYRETSFPAAELRWRIENTGASPVTIGLMLTFQNGTGAADDLAGGHHNRPFRLTDAIGRSVVGVELCHTLEPPAHGAGEAEPAGDPLHFAVAARADDGATVTYRARFSTSGDGADVWRDFAADARLDDADDPRPAAPGESIGAALAVTVRLAPGEARDVAFALSWAMPVVHAGPGNRYARRYTLFYGRDAGAAPTIARDTLACAPEWERQIVAWQEPILADAALPGWYKTALFNELYYLVDGGTAWVYPADAGPPDEHDMGHFAYLEGHDYNLLNTYDVHFYASYALAMLWPELELALQRDIAAATLAEDLELKPELYTGKHVPRKRSGAVPHDLGWPDEDPWRRINGYFVHDTSAWKDLNPKFVLQVHRDYVATGDGAFLAAVWPAVEKAVVWISQYDRDGDGLIENEGFPDQTYDVWRVKGPSAYTGGLWLASLSAAAVLAEAVGQSELAARYRATLARGRDAYAGKLWNGRYFNYDASDSPQHDSIMADQLAGHWYARSCGLPPVVAPEQARSALRTIHEYNVLRFENGTRGAVNGMRPDGRVDRASMQSVEVWAGTTYALAAAMLQEGLVAEAFKTAWGVYHTTYETSGYWFQTPEAWDARGDYRALAYMRPLAIWAMQWAWERRAKETKTS